MSKQKNHKVNFYCPMCRGTGSIIAENIDTSMPSQPHHVRCPYCAGTISVNFPSGENVSFSVQGTDSGDVEKVLSKTYTRIARQHQKNIEEEEELGVKA